MGQGEVIRKVRLDGKVAVLLGMKRSEVSAVTGALLKEVVRELVKRNSVHLDGLGELRLHFRRYKNKRRHLNRGTPHSKIVDVKREAHVSFSKAAPLSKAIRDRYGPGATEVPNGEVRS